MVEKSGQLLRALFAPCLVALVLGVAARANVVINEIMYRPGTDFPENTSLEFIELYNTDNVAVDVSGWAFTKGISFTFSQGALIGPNGYLVIAANAAALQTRYGLSGIAGEWAAGTTLSNKDENIALSRPGLVAGTFETIDEVHYASEGDWATRVRDAQFGGWEWSTPADGGDKSLELRNAALTNDHGANWAPSTAPAGATPGAPNSVATTNVAPLVHDVKHAPAVPHPNEPVTISCRVTDETAPAALSVTLFWRDATTPTPDAFQTMPMTGDGTGKFSATLPGVANLRIVEFYVSASDGTNTRTWPAPTSEGQNANCQFQATDEQFDPNDVYYLLVLTAEENAAFNNVAGTNPQSDRQFNLTFVAVRGTETTIRYLTSMRIRGNSSRGYQFKPLRISFPLDDRWEGVSDFALNPRSSFAQYIAFRMFAAAGVRAEDAVPVRPRRNGVTYSTSSGNTPDYGRWVRVEELNGDMADAHWPEAKGGNVYKKGRPDEFWRNTETPPADPEAYVDGWNKQNNGSANDWSDLFNFFAVVQQITAPHFPGSPPNNSAEGDGTMHSTNGNWDGTRFSTSEINALSQVADLDQWARWFAVMTILEDNETNIGNGQDDDYSVYFAPGTDGHRRMHLIPHDLDTVLGRGDSRIPFDARGLFDMTDDGSVFRPLLPLFGNNDTSGNSAFVAKYLGAIRELYGTIFNADTTTNPYPPFYAFLDNHLGGWVPANTITTMKTFATNRQGYLLGLIGAAPITPPPATSSSTLTSGHGEVMISELLANNVAAVQNGATFPDVIELHNAGSAPVDLGGMSLTDDPAIPGKYTFPPGISIDRGGFLLIYADTEIGAPGLHTGFALDRDGDELRLYNGATLVDSIRFGPQAVDLSISRTGASLDLWALTSPTLGGVNAAPQTLGNLSALLINEIFTNPDYLSVDDFAEIYNPGAQPVALGGVTITDDFINYPARHTLPPLSFIGAHDFLVLRPKGNGASLTNPTELPFKFSSASTWAALLGTNGTIIDRIDTNELPPDFSRGRAPDGAATLANFGLPSQIPTPGAPNVPPPPNILALLNQLRVTEVLYKPNDLEYVELQNVGATPLDITGVRFTAGISYLFATPTVLPPGGFIVVCKDRTAFTAQFGAGVPLAPGVFTGTLDNAGETIGLQPPQPWNVNVLSFKYETDWYAETNADHSLVVIDPAGTLPRDWDEKETWTPSAPLYGNPGVGLPPVITSPLAANTLLGERFQYRIAATQVPASFSATGLPPGLLFDSSTGVINGAPTQSGVFNITIGATNSGGTDSETLVLTVLDFGPLAAFEWSPNRATQNAGVPFPVTLRARDSAGHTVTSFNGTANVSAQHPAGSARVVITEIGTTSPTADYFEIENVGSAPANTTGWFVLTGRSSRGVNIPNATAWPLPATVAEGQIIGATDNANMAPTETPYGADIDWPQPPPPPGWVMLVDAGGVIRDFVAWGYTTAELATIDFNHSGFRFTLGAEWSGDGAPVIPGAQSLFRTGNFDNNSALDWSLAPSPNPRGTENAGLLVPWSPAFAPVAASPTGAVQIVDGVWTGEFTILETGTNIELHAAIAGQPLTRSSAFAVTAAVANTPPVFTKGPDQIVSEDAGAQTIIAWATAIRAGAANETGQTVTFLVSNDNPQLFAAPPAIQPDGTLTFTSTSELSGSAIVTVRARDNGGTANGGVDTSAPQTFLITVLSANDPPTLTIGGDISVTQLAGLQSVPGFATGIGPGPSNEAAQTVQVQVGNDNSALFSSPPALAADGTLTFAPSPDRSGTANVVITARDDGGTANGGDDTTQRSFTITVRLVNRVPTFVPGSNLVVRAAADFAQSWATDISPGSAAENGQTLTFSVATDRPDLFTTAPAISSDGLLTFIAARTFGTATITVVLHDDGGTADGGVDSSLPAMFTIEVSPTPTVGGKYRALVEPPAGDPRTHAQSGRIEINVSNDRSFTGKLLLGGQSFSVKGGIDNQGIAIFGRNGATLPLARKGLSPLGLRLTTDLTAKFAVINGQIVDGTVLFARFVAEHDGYDSEHRVPATLLNPATDAGNYTGVFTAQPAPNGGLNAEQFPQGDGWTTLKIAPTGTVKMRGRFADGTKFTSACALNKADALPFYVPLYKKSGSVVGRLTFETSGATRIGTPGLTWFRPAQSQPRYPAGWPNGIALGFEGAARNVVSERNILPEGGAQLAFTGGDLVAPGLARTLSVASKNKVTVTNRGEEQLRIILKANGEWSGTFIHPVNRKRASASGVVLRDLNAGRGFFLGPTASGRATIETAPAP
jgi:hypothetical protein